MIPGCETSGDLGWRSSSPIFSEPFWDLLLACRVVLVHAVGGIVSCSGWWILGHSYTTCSAVSSPIHHFLQMVSTVRPILCSQYLSSGWWPFLRRPIVVCSFLDILDSSLRSSFSPFMPYTRRILSWEISPRSGRMPDGGLRRIVVVLHTFLIG